jgi:hypothetical protein
MEPEMQVKRRYGGKLHTEAEIEHLKAYQRKYYLRRKQQLQQLNPRAEKLPRERAQKIWRSQRWSTKEALAHMQGWSLAMAYYHFGPRRKLDNDEA